MEGKLIDGDISWLQWIINLLLGLVMFILHYFRRKDDQEFRDLWDRKADKDLLDKYEKDLRDFREENNRQYRSIQKSIERILTNGNHNGGNHH